MYTSSKIIKSWKLSSVRSIKADGLIGKPMTKEASLVRGSGHPVYFLSDGKKYWITNPKTFNKFGFSDRKSVV